MQITKKNEQKHSKQVSKNVDSKKISQTERKHQKLEEKIIPQDQKNFFT